MADTLVTDDRTTVLRGIESIEYDARQHIIEEPNGGNVRDWREGPMTAKKTLSLLMAGIACAVAALLPGVAIANSGPHGGYESPTEACALCHRAHNAPSSITWTNNFGEQRTALLNTSASQVGKFCYTCHGESAQGADTNVEGGVYEARASEGAYGEPGQALNGGAWGGWVTPAMNTSNAHAGTGVAAKTTMECNVCHDVHGSSNYRLLKAKVLDENVGGYDEAGNPTPYVISAEQGAPSGGFRLHVNYVADGYVPSYTTPKNAKAPAGDTSKAISGWCTSCHKFGGGSTHFHPFNVPLSSWSGSPALVIAGNPLPVAHDPSEGAGGATPAVTDTDWIVCTTCHVAHVPHGNSGATSTQYPSLCETCHNF